MPAARAESPPLRIVFFGDSICMGQGVSIHRGWVTRISARLDVLGKEHDRTVVVVNASINGNTTRQGLERMPYDVQSHGVDVLLVQFGLNDCNYWMSDRGLPRVGLSAFAANLKEIVVRGKRFGAHHVLINTNHPTTRTDTALPHTTITYQQSNEQYNEAMRSLTALADPSVELVDIERVFMAHTKGDHDALAGLLLPDRLHLSELGHDLYFNELCPRLETVVTGLLRSAHERGPSHATPQAQTRLGHRQA